MRSISQIDFVSRSARPLPITGRSKRIQQVMLGPFGNRR
jgi:hypothetical protein